MHFVQLPPDQRGQEVSEERIRALQELGLLLKSIYLKAQKQGYRMIDGKLIPPNP